MLLSFIGLVPSYFCTWLINNPGSTKPWVLEVPPKKIPPKTPPLCNMFGKTALWLRRLPTWQWPKQKHKQQGEYQDISWDVMLRWTITTMKKATGHSEEFWRRHMCMTSTGATTVYLPPRHTSQWIYINHKNY